MKFKVLLFATMLLLLFSGVRVNAASNAIKEENKNVTVGSVDAPTLAVDITWGAMEFTLNEETNYEWKDSTKTYELVAPTYSWTANNNYIEVTNNSYTNIEVSLIYNSLYNNVAGYFNKERETITINNNMRFELNLSGTITNAENNIIRVGSIDLLIS